MASYSYNSPSDVPKKNLQITIIAVAIFLAYKIYEGKHDIFDSADNLALILTAVCILIFAYWERTHSIIPERIETTNESIQLITKNNVTIIPWTDIYMFKLEAKNSIESNYIITTLFHKKISFSERLSNSHHLIEEINQKSPNLKLIK